MIHRTLELSTSHLSREATAWLKACAMVCSATGRDGVLLAATPRGWLLQVFAEPIRKAGRPDVLLERRQMIAEAPGIDRQRAELIDHFDRAIEGLVNPAPAGMPADLWRCMARASAEECDLLLFDHDAPVLDWPAVPASPVAQEHAS